MFDARSGGSALALALALGCGSGPVTATTEGTGTSAATTGPATAGESEATTTHGTTTTNPTTATVGTTTTGTASSTASTGAPACAPDDGLCDPIAQDCCDGLKCAGVDNDADGVWDATRCRPLMGDGDHFDDCTALDRPGSGYDDCAPGYQCWNVDENLEGKCRDLCTPDCFLDFAACVTVDDVLPVCMPSCDPVTPGLCEEGEMCAPEPEYGMPVCQPDATDGLHPPGTSCDDTGLCDAEGVCLPAEVVPSAACEGSVGCCAPWCDLGDLDPCAAFAEELPGVTCVPYFDPDAGIYWLDHLGVCIVPQ